MQTSSNHQVENDPEIPLQSYRDAFANPFQLNYRPPLSAADRRLDCSQKKGTAQADMLQGLVQDARFERADVRRDVRQLRHT